MSRPSAPAATAADASDDRARDAAGHVGGEAQGLYLRDDLLEIVLGGIGSQDDDHGRAPSVKRSGPGERGRVSSCHSSLVSYHGAHEPTDPSGPYQKKKK